MDGAAPMEASNETMPGEFVRTTADDPTSIAAGLCRERGSGSGVAHVSVGNPALEQALGRRRRQHEILETLTQHRLLDLSRCGMGDIVDEDHVIGHPPVRDLAAHELEQLL